MKALVVYFSRGGNTKKVADIIAQALGGQAVDAVWQRPDTTDVDLLVVGSGTYEGKPGQKLMDFLTKLEPVKCKKAAVFATCGFIAPPESINLIKDGLKSKGYEVILDFYCFGEYRSAKQGHPTDIDLTDAKAFASDIKRRAGL